MRRDGIGLWRSYQLRLFSMKIYHVDLMMYTESNSLLPFRAPEPEEVCPVDDAVVEAGAKWLIDQMTHFGMTHPQAVHMYKVMFCKYWYEFGIHSAVAINKLVEVWIYGVLKPAYIQAREAPPPLVPPAWIAAAVVLAIVLVVVVIVAPDWNDEFDWRPPCHLYIGVYDERVWFLHLLGVSYKNVPLYKIFWDAGNRITAHTYEYVTPPDVSDRFHFWGSLHLEGWKIPWFRRYDLQYIDSTYIGTGERMGSDTYMLRGGKSDPFAPPGPILLPPDQHCRAISPLQA